jgi:hypothetical protein
MTKQSQVVCCHHLHVCKAEDAARSSYYCCGVIVIRTWWEGCMLCSEPCVPPHLLYEAMLYKLGAWDLPVCRCCVLCQQAPDMCIAHH